TMSTSIQPTYWKLQPPVMPNWNNLTFSKLAALSIGPRRVLCFAAGAPMNSFNPPKQVGGETKPSTSRSEPSPHRRRPRAKALTRAELRQQADYDSEVI